MIVLGLHASAVLSANGCAIEDPFRCGNSQCPDAHSGHDTHDRIIPLFCPTGQDFFVKSEISLRANGMATVHGVVFPPFGLSPLLHASQAKRAAPSGRPLLLVRCGPLTPRPAFAEGRVRRTCGSRRPGDPRGRAPSAGSRRCARRATGSAARRSVSPTA